MNFLNDSFIKLFNTIEFNKVKINRKVKLNQNYSLSAVICYALIQLFAFLQRINNYICLKTKLTKKIHLKIIYFLKIKQLNILLNILRINKLQMSPICFT